MDAPDADRTTDEPPSTERPLPFDLTIDGRGGAVNTIAFGQLTGRPVLAAGSDDGTIRLWNPLSGMLLAEPMDAHRGAVLSLAFGVSSLGDAVLASASNDGTVRLWNPDTGTQRGDPLTAHTRWATSVAFGRLSNGRGVFASGGNDGIVRLWDPDTGNQLGAPVFGVPGVIAAVALASLVDGRAILASAADDGVVRLTEPDTGKQIAALSIGRPSGPVPMVFGRVFGTLDVLAAGDGEGAVRLWNPSTGTRVGPMLADRKRGVTALAFGRLADEHVVLADAGGDGIVRLWDLDTDAALGDQLVGPRRGVTSLAFDRFGDGRVVLASGGKDGSIRLWSNIAFSEPTVVRPETIRGAATFGTPTVTTAESAVVEPETLHATTSIGEPGVEGGEPAAAESAAPEPIADESAVAEPTAVSAADEPDTTADAVDSAATESAAEEPVATESVAESVVPEPVVPEPISTESATDSAAATESAAAEPAPVEPSSAAEVAEPATDTTAGPAVEGEPPARKLRTDAPAARDDVETADRLSRDVLAAHLSGLLSQLTRIDATGDARQGSAVVHIDGRWGSGKSTLVTLLRRRLVTPATAEGGTAPSEERLRDPIFAHYNAWQESAIAPEWWSLATTINRAVRSERAGVTRLLMVVHGMLTRLVRSPPVLVAGGLLAAALAARASGVWRDPQNIAPWITALTTVAVIGLGAGRALFWTSPTFGRLHVKADDNPLGEIAAIVGRLRRWSPREGRPHRLADGLLALWLTLVAVVLTRVLVEQPGGRAATVELGRWVRDHALPLALAAATCALALAGWRRVRPSHPDAAVPPEPPAMPPVARRGAPGLRAAVDRAVGWAAPPRVAVARWATAAASGVARWAAARVVVAVALGVLVWLAATVRVPDGVSRVLAWQPVLSAVVLVGAGLLAHVAWTARGRRRPRRPLVLVVDDLDRCTAERTVKLLETIHTLLLDRTAPRGPFRSLRRPAALIVLVLADGRWVRSAFETTYQAFGPLGSPVHGLGADFVQKLFHHTVLVPALTGAQITALLDTITDTTPEARPEPGVTSAGPSAGAPTGSPTGTTEPSADVTAPAGSAESATAQSGSASAGSAQTGSGQPESAESESTSARRRAITAIREHDPSRLDDPAIQRIVHDDALRGADGAAVRAELAAHEAAAPDTRDREAHLLSNYAHVMPGNPRQIKLIANAWTMLRAVQLHLNTSPERGPSQEHLVRAAIMFIRFPTLVDELLSASVPPDTEPPDDPPSPHYPPPPPPPWSQPDVRQVLTLDDTTRMSLDDLARCYGKTFIG